MRKIVAFLLMMSLVVLLCSCSVSEVVERTGMTKSEIQEVYDEAEALLNDEEYLEAMYKFERISGFKDAEDKANLAYEKYCSDILVAAEKLAGNENYTEAINVLTDALNEVGEEERFINYGLELRETYMKKMISLVDTYVAENSFDSAYAILESLEEFVGEDGAIDAKLIEIKNSETAYNKNNLMTLINDFDGSDNKSLDAYEKIIHEIEAQLDIIGNDPEIAGIITKYKNAYCDAILAAAENAFDKDGYEEAIAVINMGLKMLSDDEELTDALTKYQEYIPVSAAELAIVDEYGFDYGAFKDSLKNEHKNAHKLGVAFPSNDCRYVEFFVGGKYDFISGTYFPSDNLPYDTCRLHIYKDDVLVWSSDIISKKTLGTNFSVDISNANYVRIELDAHCLWEAVIISNMTVYKE